MLSEVPETNKLIDLVLQALVCLQTRSGQDHRRFEGGREGELVWVDFATVDGANEGLCIKLLPILKCWQCYMYGRCNQMDVSTERRQSPVGCPDPGVNPPQCENSETGQ